MTTQPFLLGKIKAHARAKDFFTINYAITKKCSHHHQNYKQLLLTRIKMSDYDRYMFTELLNLRPHKHSQIKKMLVFEDDGLKYTFHQLAFVAKEKDWKNKLQTHRIELIQNHIWQLFQEPPDFGYESDALRKKETTLNANIYTQIKTLYKESEIDRAKLYDKLIKERIASLVKKGYKESDVIKGYLDSACIDEIDGDSVVYCFKERVHYNNKDSFRFVKKVGGVDAVFDSFFPAWFFLIKQVPLFVGSFFKYLQSPKNSAYAGWEFLMLLKILINIITFPLYYVKHV